MTHHTLDVYPLPRDKRFLYINEPWLTDLSLMEQEHVSREPEAEPDNIRVYIPTDLNRKAILRRLDSTIARFGEATEDNEIFFSIAVDSIISQMEIYDQVRYTRHMPKGGDHSVEGVSLVREMIDRLEAIPDGCAERFPFETIDALKKEYLPE